MQQETQQKYEEKYEGKQAQKQEQKHDQDLRLICGDAAEEMAKLADKSVRLIVTDPPYNVNKDYGTTRDNMSLEDWLAFSRTWLREAKRVLTDDGSLYVFMGMRGIAWLYIILEQELKLHFNSWITWHYTQGIGRTRGYSPRHDDILFFTKHPRNFLFNLDAVRVPQKAYRAVNNMRGANPGNVWEFSHVHFCTRSRTSHPTQKPEGLYERIILASSREQDLVLDPFVGSGTALRVCQQTQRRCIGIDSNPDYIGMAQERLARPFQGFDSIDRRMERVPDALNDEELRAGYLKQHIQWFLRNHPESVHAFLKEAAGKYPAREAGRGE